MKIKTILALLCCCLVGSCLLIALILRQSIVQVQNVTERDEIIHKITTTLFERSALRDTFLLFREEYAIAQWYAKAAQFEQLLDQATDVFPEPNARALMAELRQENDNTKPLFAAIVANWQQPKGLMAHELEERIIGQVFAKMQWMMTVSAKLSALSRAAMVATQRHSVSAAMSTLVITLITIIGMLAWLSAVVARPLTRLRQGTEALSRGDFVYRIPLWSPHGGRLPIHNVLGRLSHVTELNTLASTFNHMAGELGTFYTRLEQQVKERTQALTQSNADLEQFAYIASHDLQEPLRAVSGCVQILQRRYQDVLDARAKELIGHTVEGTSRMQALINGLLDYSRISSRGMPLEPVDCTVLLKEVLANLTAAITESGAVITSDTLPTVPADSAQLAQVFQNLIGNALKFRHETSPEIHIGVERTAEEWVFAIRDNGIGIEPQYFERIFLMFQRLHTRQEYAGTGIGLGLCKKIVERHAGRIWVTSQMGQGTTFFFTIPDRR